MRAEWPRPRGPAVALALALVVVAAPHLANAAEACPEQCSSPSCKQGATADGGVSLRHERCTSRCSGPIHGVRFCGAGTAYAGEESLDCTGCGEVQVDLPEGGKVGISTRGPLAFRVRVIPDFGMDCTLNSPMIDPDDSHDARYDKKVDGSGTVVTAYAGDGMNEAIGSITVSQRGTIMLHDSAGRLLTESNPIRSDSLTLQLTTANGKLYGRGASPLDAHQLTATSADPMVCNRASYVPYYYSTDGYSAFGVAEKTHFTHLPATYSSDGAHISWTFQGQYELYLMPAATLKEGTEAYYSLTGKPAVLPRYAFGFIASRWGWKDRDDIETTLKRFRKEKYPIDVIILDFEWFTSESDYKYEPEGEPDYMDFGFNDVTLPAPKTQLAEYRNDLHIRMGGIRKPRLGNSKLLAMARDKDWLYETGEQSGGYPPGPESKNYALGRNLEFHKYEVRQWYADQLKHLYEDGMSFFWNDEGETNYFTFHWWNVAQQMALDSVAPTKRFFSLNRAWTPGMARLGATTWTGDVDPSWEDLKTTPGIMLNWALAGAPYVGCDIGGFDGPTNAPLLTRWMQAGIFMPLMRVHSTEEVTPHWPWLWGNLASSAMRQALELRYRLVPYHYSLAHAMHKKGSLWVRPLVMDFPDDAKAAEITEQWMDGEILVAPVVREDNLKEIYLPAGTWYPFGGSSITQGTSPNTVLSGPTHIGGAAAQADVPAYVRAGAVITLAPVIQDTTELPGGPLEVQVYAGADGSFELVEDDGETNAYKHGQSRSIHFKWNDAATRLSWTMTGSVLTAGRHAFSEMRATLFDASGPLHSPTYKLGIVGSIDFSQLGKTVSYHV